MNDPECSKFSESEIEVVISNNNKKGKQSVTKRPVSNKLTKQSTNHETVTTSKRGSAPQKQKFFNESEDDKPAVQIPKRKSVRLSIKDPVCK
jgi:hypothetical protein